MSTTSATSPASIPAFGSQHRKVAFASLMGTSVEWYDFYLYGTYAALLFPKLFFPELSPLAGTLSSFATYAVGFAARPIGAAIFGHYGDRIGRKTMLLITLLLMGGSTVLIGALPTYETAGIWAAIMLCFLRLIQGFAIGGEWGSAVVIAVEHAPAHRRGLYGSFPQIGVPIGLLLSTGAFALTSALLDESQILSWGWRIPFLASIVMLGIGIFIRLGVQESPVFQRLKQADQRSERPAGDLILYHRRMLILTIGMKMLQNAIFYIYSVFMLSYITGTLGLPRSVGLNAIIISSLVGIATIPLWSWLSDLIGRRKIYLFGNIASMLFLIPFFIMADTGNVVLITIGMIIGLNVLHDSMYGPQAVYFSELFGTSVRLSGTNIGYSIGAVLSGGLAPMIATSLLAAQNGKTWGIVAYLMTLGVISVVCTVLAGETYKRAIER